MQRTNVQNLVTGVTEGFTKVLEITGGGYRAAGPRQEPAAAARLQPRRELSRSLKASTSKLPTRTRSRSAASTSSRSARSRPRSAAGASRSPTRARASSIAASISPQGRQEEVAMAPLSLFDRRRRRVRTALKARASASLGCRCTVRPAHLCADHRRRRGNTVASASTLDKDLKGKTGATKDGAAAVGKPLPSAPRRPASRSVVFDRGGFLFHGRVKALADAAREGGLEF